MSYPVAACRGHWTVAGGAGNGLLNNLVAYWPLNEAGGANNALDLHSNSLTLTQRDSPGADTGLVYASARTIASGDQFYRNSEALLLTGDIDFTVACWVYITNETAERAIIGKYTTTGNQREHLIEYLNTTDRFRFLVSADGTGTFVAVSATTFGAVPASTWCLVLGQHDSVNNTIGISINGGAVDTTAHSTGVFSGTSIWQIGDINTGSTIPWTGRLGPAMFWKSAAGAGGILTAAQKTALYNAGLGLTYAVFTL